ncbi:unnamed protein product [Symbiodinium pilosum]|uniref:F5/8 type C domain-containing protein n=1 Tax=Symbiodinium pilosum TaxID=2952 RepID=A0A812M1N8_SYMPI|nr:unnamed protein product [Symbiodinium pilosum]
MQCLSFVMSLLLIQGGAQRSCPYRYLMLQVHACNDASQSAWSVAGLAFRDNTGKIIDVPATRSNADLHRGRPRVPASFGFSGTEPWNVLDGNPFSILQVDDTYSVEGEIDRGRDLSRPTFAAMLVIDLEVPRQVGSYTMVSRRDGSDDTHPRRWTLRGSNDLTSWANMSTYDLHTKPFPEGEAGFGRIFSGDLVCGELE